MYRAGPPHTRRLTPLLPQLAMRLQASDRDGGRGYQRPPGAGAHPQAHATLNYVPPDFHRLHTHLGAQMRVQLKEVGLRVPPILHHPLAPVRLAVQGAAVALRAAPHRRLEMLAEMAVALPCEVRAAHVAHGVAALARHPVAAVALLEPQVALRASPNQHAGHVLLHELAQPLEGPRLGGEAVPGVGLTQAARAEDDLAVRVLAPAALGH
mmetsp:Transcript_59663/g.106403  ORF Transcript_59663/g.106403 Transcript_59663/m.106403 type:complete len:210 (+) Transcript_59663:209-838(+)